MVASCIYSRKRELSDAGASRMNERIKELAEQAEKYADENFKGEPTYSEAYDSKFAELIVRECAGIAGCNGHVSGFTLGDLIKEHFGVEEWMNRVTR